MKYAALLVLCLPIPALAVDPLCDGLIGEPPVYQGCSLKASDFTETLTFCTPQLDVDGDPLLLGSLLSCTVVLDGVGQTVPAVDPGELVSVTVTGKSPGHLLSAWCTNIDGLSGDIWTSDFCFPSGKPSKPWKQ